MSEKEINYLLNEFKKIDNKFMELDKRIDNLSKLKQIKISNEVILYLIYCIVIILILIITFIKIGG